MAVLAVVVLVHNFFQLEVSGNGLDSWNHGEKFRVESVYGDLQHSQG